MIFKILFNHKMIETFSLSIITLILLNQIPSELDKVSRDIKSDVGLGVRNCSTILFMFMAEKKQKIGHFCND